MATTTIEAPASPLTQERVEAIAVELLGDLLGQDPGELTDELLARGAHMPVDSLDVFDILQGVRERTGVKLPADKRTSRSMRSVKDFARRVCEVAGS